MHFLCRKTIFSFIISNILGFASFRFILCFSFYFLCKKNCIINWRVYRWRVKRECSHELSLNETASSSGKNERISARKNTVDPFYMFKYTHLPPFSITIITWQFAPRYDCVRLRCAACVLMSSFVFGVVSSQKRINQQIYMKSE